jgi:chromosome segregation ATPase
VEAAEAQKRAAIESESLAKEKAQAVKANSDKSLDTMRADYEKKIEHMESSLQLKNKEIEEKGTKSTMLRQKLDETMHKLEVATAVRDRRQGEINSREEEICALQVRLKEVEVILGQYKSENEKFFKLKEKYKATIASLEGELRKKEAEKVTLTQMCDQLLSEKEERVLSSKNN